MDRCGDFNEVMAEQFLFPTGQHADYSLVDMLNASIFMWLRGLEELAICRKRSSWNTGTLGPASTSVSSSDIKCFLQMHLSRSPVDFRMQERRLGFLTLIR